MNVLEIHAFFVGIPLVIVLILVLLIWSGQNRHPATYKMSDEWTHEPILWAAVEERVGDAHGHSSSKLTVGGGASGKW